MRLRSTWIKYLATFVLALGLGSLALTAQENQTKMKGGKNVMVTGCLQKGDDANEFNLVTKAGGTVKTEIWGRRRLAYEIKKQVEGIYAIVTIESEPAAVAELDRQLNLNESVLRTKLMRPEAH